jgi:hypothetical protein
LEVFSALSTSKKDGAAGEVSSLPALRRAGAPAIRALQEVL